MNCMDHCKYQRLLVQGAGVQNRQARVGIQNLSMIAFAYSWVFALPPKSPVKYWSRQY